MASQRAMRLGGSTGDSSGMGRNFTTNGRMVKGSEGWWRMVEDGGGPRVTFTNLHHPPRPSTPPLSRLSYGMPQPRFTLLPQSDPNAVEPPSYRPCLSPGVFTARP